MKTRDEKLEVAAGEYAQSMKFKKNPDYLYINLVDAFIAGSRWSETEDYYYGKEVNDICQLLRACMRELQTKAHISPVNVALVGRIKEQIKGYSNGDVSGRLTQSTE